MQFQESTGSQWILNTAEWNNNILIRIEGASYASNKEKHNDYLWFHPYVAKKRFINLYSTGKFD